MGILNADVYTHSKCQKSHKRKQKEPKWIWTAYMFETQFQDRLIYAKLRDEGLSSYFLGLIT